MDSSSVFDLTAWEIIKWTCLNAAKFLNIDNVFGSLEIGKSPGLNIVSGIDFTKQQLSNEAELKVLI
ncbi:amidohydrolase family protein [Marinifilum sp.]|uniref:amidohydrolase family protein n=1 Tax=Marinifilum sp. TaxID=2033137 RepID=UPI003BA919DC